MTNSHPTTPIIFTVHSTPSTFRQILICLCRVLAVKKYYNIASCASCSFLTGVAVCAYASDRFSFDTLVSTSNASSNALLHPVVQNSMRHQRAVLHRSRSSLRGLPPPRLHSCRALDSPTLPSVDGVCPAYYRCVSRLAAGYFNQIVLVHYSLSEVCSQIHHGTCWLHLSSRLTVMSLNSERLLVGAVLISY